MAPVQSTRWRPTRKATSLPMLPFALQALGGLWIGSAIAEAAEATPPAASERMSTAAASEAELGAREKWRQTIVHTPKPGKGCFEASFPATQWQPVPCGKPNGKLYRPKAGGMTRTDVVGGAGTDFSAQVSGHISQAEGSFDSVSGVTSESNSNGAANSYSLQLNTNTFQGKACNSAPDKANCTAWEQFVYDSGGSTQIQYWLINWGAQGSVCPAPQGANCKQGVVSSDGWCPQSVSGFTDVLCVIDAASPPPASAEPATSLQQLTVTGIAGSGSTADSMTMSVGGHVTTGSGGNYFTDLASNWQVAEFNVFGDSNDQANFNTGSTLVVRTSVDSGTAGGPACDLHSFTAESNNLTLVATDATPPKSQFPSLVFTESNDAGSMQASCADAVSIGDTHLTAFDGLHYDFQASGEFVLVQDGRDFTVQTRQASGAPNWPQAAVNKAVAIEMRRTRVALYIEPVRLVVDGAARELADGRTLNLADGVQVSRHGGQYLVSDENGNSVQATLNSSWIDVRVGLGRAQSGETRGLLGNPKGDAHALVTSTGVSLREPVSFNDLYHQYADSWRVRPNETLFSEPTAIKPDIPSKPFFAKDLGPAAEARAREVCKTAGVAHPDLVEDCTLDLAVLNDETAAKPFIHAPVLLRHVIKPAI